MGAAAVWQQADFLGRLRAAQQRYAQFGMQIYSGVHYSYQSRRIQLGEPGRDQDIETYRQFVRDLGKLEIPIASYDFHPANTYTTKMVEHRGYTAREFDLNDFRTTVEKIGASPMKALPLVGVLLLVLGVLSFVVPIPHSENHGVKIGDAKISVETQSSDKLPPAAGIVLLAGGVVALVLGLRKT